MKTSQLLHERNIKTDRLRERKKETSPTDLHHHFVVACRHRRRRRRGGCDERRSKRKTYFLFCNLAVSSAKQFSNEKKSFSSNLFSFSLFIAKADF